jgi:S-DNA-T family DNA segregation ATPase FtsK/SpoIIIE
VTGFSFAGFVVPIYLASAAVLLLGKRFSRRHVAIQTVTIVPFLTLALMLRILTTASAGRIGELIRSMFTTVGSGALLSVVFALEVSLILRYIANHRGSGKQPEYKGPVALLPSRSKDEPLADTPGFVPILEGVDPGPAAEESDQSGPAAEEEAAKLIGPLEPEIVDAQYEYMGDETVEEPESALSETKPRTVGPYAVPVDNLLMDYPDGQYWKIDDETRESSEVLRGTLEEFKIQAEVTGIRKGPVITMFEILPAPGVKLSKIVNLADNIALRLAASRVRIVAPIPGKHAVGIEVPNKHRAIVSFKEMIQDEIFDDDNMEIPIALGKDITGEAQIIDLTKTPHLLIAGATGAGKSVCANAIIASILYKRKPADVRILLIDPKIVELKLYNDIPHLLTPVITEPKKAYQALQYCIYEMERRYSLLDALGVRDIRSYNKKIRSKKLATLPLPYIVILVDEFADLMSTIGKDLESTLARLAAMSRAVGIHLVLATQRPSVDVITGLIKANIPSRIAFMVASKFDSRIIIDGIGAEKLLGRGDMLFTSAWDPVPQRIQGAFLSEQEVEHVTDYVKTLGEPDYIDEEVFLDDDDPDNYSGHGEDDPLMEQALDIVVQAGKASASYLQRKLKIGYNRAARLVEEMEMRGIVGPQQGSKPRELLHVPVRSGD